MEKRDQLIIKYLVEGFKVNEIRGQLNLHHSIVMSESLVEKRLSNLRKLYKAKTLFQLAIHLKDEKVI